MNAFDIRSNAPHRGRLRIDVLRPQRRVTNVTFYVPTGLGHAIAGRIPWNLSLAERDTDNRQRAA
jgi:hypothetical protein